MATGVSSNQTTIQSIIDKTTAASSKTGKRNTGALGKDDFLNLLVTQLRYQDPLQPTDDKEFIGQMAQFSALEQMQNLNSAATGTQAFAMIGKTIVGSIKNEKTLESEPVTGVVSSVKFQSGKALLVVGDKDVPIENVTDVKNSDSTETLTDLTKYANLVGMNVQGVVYDTADNAYAPVTGQVTSVQRGETQDYAVLDGVTAELNGVYINNQKVTDRDQVMAYLNSKIGTSVEVVVNNRLTGKSVPVTAQIDSIANESGRMMAKMSKMAVPVLSIADIHK